MSLISLECTSGDAKTVGSDAANESKSPLVGAIPVCGGDPRQQSALSSIKTDNVRDHTIVFIELAPYRSLAHIFDKFLPCNPGTNSNPKNFIVLFVKLAEAARCFRGLCAIGAV